MASIFDLRRDTCYHEAHDTRAGPAGQRSGKDWGRDALAAAHPVGAVAWNGQDLIAVGDGGTIIRSSDGDRWPTVVDSGTSEPLNDVAWGNGRFVAVGWNGTIVVSP